MENLINKKKSEKNEEIKTEDNNEENKVKEIIDKWYILQKTIKEEITLKEMITSQQEIYKNKLIENYRKYYKSKLEIREISENIILIDKYELKKLRKFNEFQEAEDCLQDAYDPISKLLFLMRNNYDYILKIFSLINDEDILLDNKKEIESLIDLICNQFYDNILIPNPEQEELLILIYLLLEKEICSMNSASVSAFLDSENTIIGLFLKSYIKKQELKNYLSMTLSSLILSIENNSNDCLDLNLSNIKIYIDKNIKKKDNEGNEMKNIYEPENIFLTKNIPHCKINFHTKFIFKEKKNENEEEEEEEEDEEDKLSSNNINNNSQSSNISIDSNYKKRKNSNINYDYKNDLTQNELNERYNKEKDINLKEFYHRQLERINKDSDIFTNKKFLKSLKEFPEQQRYEILKKYKENFQKIQKYIDTIIQSLIDKIAAIPYALRCICKIIFMLIKKKFNKISKYEKNAFIGEFIFGKCILPILINCDINAIITSTILSRKTRNCLIEISKVLTQINRGSLFESNLETDFTLFNHYLIEVIPLINKFYDNLIDVPLPRVVDNLLKKKLEENDFPIIRNLILNNINNDNDNKIVEYKGNELYNYFEENKEEIYTIQCICFSIEDILFLIKIIRNNLNEFKDLPKFNLFSKTMGRIISDEYKLDQLVIKSKSERKFFLIFKEEENPEYSNLLNPKENTFPEIKDNNDIDFILHRVKICIKTVLTGLNLLNSKDYPYLNISNCSKNFFLAVKYTLDDFDDTEDSELYNGIPLIWYSQYILNNIEMLSEDYLTNDLQKLYEIIFKEEYDTLQKLRNFSSIVNTRFGLNQRCSEKIIEKTRKNIFKVRQIERLMKMEKFILKQEIIVYMIFNKSKFDSNLIIKLNNDNNNEDEEDDKILPTFSITTEIPQKINLLNKKDPNIILLKKISEFIKIFNSDNSKFKNLPNPINYYVKEDIAKGEQRHKFYKTLNDYIEIIQNSINKSEIFNKDSDIEKLFIKEGIQNYILKKIYKSVFPKNPLEKDNEFYIKVSKLSWITPDKLDVKKIYVNELKFAEKCISKIDEGKTVFDKLKSIAEAHNTINTTIKFSTGKNDDAGADDLSPIFQYIIIKAKPKRFFSNIYYIKCFLGNSQKGINGFLLTQMEFAAQYILKIDYVKLKMSKEEFENNIRKVSISRRKSSFSSG